MKNKYIEKTGLYGLIEEKGLGKLKDGIEESVLMLHHWRDGGELEASEAYAAIIRDAPPKAVEGGIKVLSELIRFSNDRSYKSDAGKDAKAFSSHFLRVIKEVPEDLWEDAIHDMGTAPVYYYSGMLDTISSTYKKVSSLTKTAKEKALSDLKELKNDHYSSKAALVDSYKILSDVFEGDLLLKKMETVRKLYKLSDKLVDEAKAMAIEHIKKGG
ncbi:MAG: hypothetical protein HZB68_01455 [Candidatus Aenigmarchaeota archaeon]|nr:hypothetical protein [Candidatus Aenigmarchaeota archaeon]